MSLKLKLKFKENKENKENKGNKENKEHNKLKMIDLCAGTGAFSYAFKDSCDIVFSNDFDKSSKIIYDINLKDKLICEDICLIPINIIPQHDILCAGFPCQPFSIAGKKEGFDDPRSNVFWKIIEIDKFHNPKCIFLENVKNILTHDNGETFNTIINSLKN